MSFTFNRMTLVARAGANPEVRLTTRPARRHTEPPPTGLAGLAPRPLPTGTASSAGRTGALGQAAPPEEVRLLGYGECWQLETGRWDFGTTDGLRLYKHLRTCTVRHLHVQQDRSPFDGAWIYWSTRLGRHPELQRGVARLLKWQKGRCARCGLYFRDEDLPEVDHIVPTSLGGKDGYIN